MKVVTFKPVSGTLEQMKAQNEKNWAKANKAVKQGRMISLTELIGGAETIHIEQYKRSQI